MAYPPPATPSTSSAGERASLRDETANLLTAMFRDNKALKKERDELEDKLRSATEKTINLKETLTEVLQGQLQQCVDKLQPIVTEGFIDLIEKVIPMEQRLNASIGQIDSLSGVITSCGEKQIELGRRVEALTESVLNAGTEIMARERQHPSQGDGDCIKIQDEEFKKELFDKIDNLIRRMETAGGKQAEVQGHSVEDMDAENSTRECAPPPPPTGDIPGRQPNQKLTADKDKDYLPEMDEGRSQERTVRRSARNATVPARATLASFAVSTSAVALGGIRGTDRAHNMRAAAIAAKARFGRQLEEKEEEER